MMSANTERFDRDDRARNHEAPDSPSSPIEAAMHYLTKASIALSCVGGPFEPIAQATARDIDRYARAINSVSEAIEP